MMKKCLDVITVVQVLHRAVAVQIAAVAVWGQLKMDAEQVAKPPVMMGVMIAVKIRPSLHHVLIVVPIAVTNVRKIAKMIAMLLQRHRLALVVVIAAIGLVHKIVITLVEPPVTLHARDNVQVLVLVIVMSLAWVRVKDIVRFLVSKNVAI